MIHDVGTEDFAQAYVYETTSTNVETPCMLVQLSSHGCQWC